MYATSLQNLGFPLSEFVFLTEDVDVFGSSTSLAYIEKAQHGKPNHSELAECTQMPTEEDRTLGTALSSAGIEAAAVFLLSWRILCPKQFIITFTPEIIF